MLSCYTTIRNTLSIATALVFASSAAATPCDHVDHTISCGDTISVEMPSATSVMEDYYFISGYDAGEYVMEWTAPAGISRLDVVHASLEDNAVFMMGPNSCDSDETGWWNDTGNGYIDSGLTSGDTFYLAVDADASIPFGSWVSVSFMCDLDPYENCFMAGDEDGDGLEECDDPNCTYYVGCLSLENCTNTLDDDGDGLVDCDDPDCANFGGCDPEDCTDGIDNNGNGLVDCDDPWCIFQGMCPETECDDLEDNDGDGLIDCQDSDCPNYPCPDEDCTNGVDDNLDGWADCEDLSCACDPVCWGGEVCDNGVDDDGDGAVDCNDCECFQQDACIGEDCGNGIDDEGDGFVDCDDPECENHPDCGESETECNDFVDNDFDGQTDCDDPDCLDDAYCTGLCEVIAELSCGETFSWTSVGDGHTDIFQDHSACGGSAAAYNPETAFAMPDALILEVVVSPGSGGLDGVVLVENPDTDECNQDLDCVASAGPGETLSFEPTSAAALYAIVESDGAEAEFDITVTCLQEYEDCDQAGDQDGDGLDDCEDDDCADHEFADADGDGFDACADCDDDDAMVNPYATEICDDGIDNDCDDLVDGEESTCGLDDGPGQVDDGQGCSCKQDNRTDARNGSHAILAFALAALGLAVRRRDVQGRMK